jgi:hypothetical protein
LRRRRHGADSSGLQRKAGFSQNMTSFPQPCSRTLLQSVVAIGETFL